MGALDNVVGEIFEGRRQLSWRPVGLIAATPTNLFTIAGGSVKIFAISAWIVNAITTGVTWHMTAGAIPLDAALFAALAGANTMVAWPLAVGAALVPPAQGTPSPSALAQAAGLVGITATPSNLILTYGVALIDGTVGFSVEWEALSPNSTIVPV